MFLYVLINLQIYYLEKVVLVSVWVGVVFFLMKIPVLHLKILLLAITPQIITAEAYIAPTPLTRVLLMLLLVEIRLLEPVVFGVITILIQP